MEIWTVRELRNYARCLGIVQRGRKSELIAQIIRAEFLVAQRLAA